VVSLEIIAFESSNYTGNFNVKSLFRSGLLTTLQLLSLAAGQTYLFERFGNIMHSQDKNSDLNGTKKDHYRPLTWMKADNP